MQASYKKNYSNDDSQEKSELDNNCTNIHYKVATNECKTKCKDKWFKGNVH